jgi:microcystin-dependent protein
MPSNPFLGEIFMAGFNFAPRGYAMCNGQVLPIAQNTALFSLLGTTYGGNGQTTFALPDLRGRVPVHVGQGPGLSPYSLGQNGGTETVTLGANQIPAHNHPLNATTAGGDQLLPTDNLIAPDALGGTAPFKTGSSGPNTAMAASSIGQAGGGQPHNNLQPYLVLNFYIAVQGIFPSRN